MEKYGSKAKLLRSLRQQWNSQSLDDKIKIAKKYSKVLRRCKNEDIDFLIRLANDGLIAAEHFSGSFYSDQIEFRIYELFKNLSLGVLSSNQFGSVRSVLSKYEDNDLYHKIEEIKSKIIKNDDYGAQLLISLLCSFKTIREIFIFIENDFGYLIEEIKSSFSDEAAIQFINIVNTFLITPSITIQKAKYTSHFLNYFKIHNRAFDSLWSVILLLYNTSHSPNLVKLLKKFWEIFPDKQTEIFTISIKILKKSELSSDSEIINQSCEFLYKIFTDSQIQPYQKAFLKSELPNLFFHNSFRYQSEKSFSVAELKLYDMFPLFLDIEAGDSYSISIPVKKNDIFYIEFVLTSQTIHFLISTEKNLYLSQDVVESSKPFISKFVIEDDDVIRVNWDNSFSWFQNKTLRYRVVVLQKQEQNEEVLAYCDQECFWVKRKGEEVKVVTGTEQDLRAGIGKLLKGCKLLVLVSDFEVWKSKKVDWGVNAEIFLDVEVAALAFSRELGIRNVIFYSDKPVLRFAAVQGSKVLKVNRNVEQTLSITEFILKNIEIFPNYKIFLFNLNNLEIAERDLKKFGIDFQIVYKDTQYLIEEFEKLKDNYFNKLSC